MTDLTATPYKRCGWCGHRCVVVSENVCVTCRPDVLAARFDDEHDRVTAVDRNRRARADRGAATPATLRNEGFRWSEIPGELKRRLLGD